MLPDKDQIKSLLDKSLPPMIYSPYREWVVNILVDVASSGLFCMYFTFPQSSGRAWGL